MRIIAGQRRGHKIDGPRNSAETRPTSDLVRESLFNILGELVVDRPFIDLFAGTGAVGLEALSRGADRAIFVERGRENIGLIFRNVATLRYESRVQVRHADAYRWVRTFEPAAGRPVIAFVDPPYRDYQVRTKRLNLLIAELVEKVPPGSAVALEAGRLLDGRILTGYDTWDIRRYGNTRVAIKVVAASDEGASLPSEAALVPSDSAGEKASSEDRRDD
jgi:16S rRNA (guanine966-N2)-methyltransferase